MAGLISKSEVKVKVKLEVGGGNNTELWVKRSNVKRRKKNILKTMDEIFDKEM